jgi:hypothetical protein
MPSKKNALFLHKSIFLCIGDIRTKLFLKKANFWKQEDAKPRAVPSLRSRARFCAARETSGMLDGLPKGVLVFKREEYEDVYSSP